MSWKENLNNLAKETEEQRNEVKKRYEKLYEPRHKLHHKVERICKEFAEKLGGDCKIEKWGETYDEWCLDGSSFKIGWKTEIRNSVEVHIYHCYKPAHIKVSTKRCTESLKSKCPNWPKEEGIYYSKTVLESTNWGTPGREMSGTANCIIPIEKFSEQTFAEILSEFCKETMDSGASKFRWGSYYDRLYKKMKKK